MDYSNCCSCDRWGNYHYNSNHKEKEIGNVSKISIVNVNDYGDIQQSVVAAIKMIESDFHFNFLNSNSILLKPNLLVANKNACTQPSFVEGIVSYLKEIGVSMDNVNIGDSPGQYKTSATNIAKKIGLYDICDKLGIKFIDFEGDAPIKEEIEGALRIKKYYIAKAVKECDILINLPRLKTHAEATITGAIKNYWGIIPGGIKSKYHLLGKTPDQFGEALTDNYSWVVKNKPNRLIVYDLHTIMEGSMGPVAGTMKTWNLILTGTDELALDLAALEIGKFKGILVPHLKIAIKRNLGIYNLNDIEFVGMSLKEAKNCTPKFKGPNEFFTKITNYLGKIGYKILKKIPVLSKTSCRKCGQCAQICPAKAIYFKENHYPNYLRKKCISCLCCMEMCPHHAIVVRTRGISGLNFLSKSAFKLEKFILIFSAIIVMSLFI
ncbi:MAG: DUF362 domain-containing protein [Candidatus Hodarchaeota archaeon]